MENQAARSVIVNCDGYISVIAGDIATIEFRSGDRDHGVNTAGGFIARDAEANEIPKKSIAAEFNLPQRPWWERLEESVA